MSAEQLVPACWFGNSVDFVAQTPVPPRLEQAVRAALRGECGHWPETLSRDEIQALVNHGIAPLVYAASRHPQLREEAIRAAALEPLRSSDASEVLAHLASRGIETLVLKGGALAYLIYEAPEMRPRSDIDLLVAASDMTAVRKAMQELGFREHLSSGDEEGLRQTTFFRNVAGLEHSYDVHWAVTNTPVFALAGRWDELRKRSVPVPALGPHARGLDPVDALLLACIHRVAHHHDSDRLIWLVDIALLRDRMTGEQHAHFWQQAVEARVVAVCSRSVELADDWMSRPSRHRAEDWLQPEQLTQSEPSRRFLDRDLTRGRLLVADMRALSWRSRMIRLRQLAFPPAAFMHESFPAHGRFALPWLYVYRGARGIMRLFRRARV